MIFYFKKEILFILIFSNCLINSALDVDRRTLREVVDEMSKLNKEQQIQSAVDSLLGNSLVGKNPVVAFKVKVPKYVDWDTKTITNQTFLELALINKQHQVDIAKQKLDSGDFKAVIDALHSVLNLDASIDYLRKREPDAYTDSLVSISRA